MGLVFFSRCKPQGCDAVNLALAHKIIFFGYPALKDKYDPTKLDECLIDPDMNDEAWQILKKKHKLHKEQSASHNLVLEIKNNLQKGEKVIGLIPRPSMGVIYAGEVQRFKLHRNPAWASEYIEMRQGQKPIINYDDQEGQHIADVAQCWHVDKFHKIPYHQIPGWIVSSIMGRATLGRVNSDENRRPYDVMNALLTGQWNPLQWTCEIAEIRKRLADYCTPAVFEHLCVHLLQVINPHMIWRHVGGSGDDGVDGIGATKQEVTHILQCKLRGLDVGHFKREATKRGGQQLVIATLDSVKDDSLPPNMQLWALDKVADLVQQHMQSLPLATSLRIGNAPR